MIEPFWGWRILASSGHPASRSIWLDGDRPAAMTTFRFVQSSLGGWIIERREFVRPSRYVAADSWSAAALAAAILALLCAAELAAIIAMTNGEVLFSQDDPYIHLALAERLTNNLHYGINPGEVVAPASSILYPFLLVPFVALGLGQVGALLICVASTMASGALTCAILQASGYDLKAIPRVSLIVLIVAVALAFNLPGLAFTGLENALHVTISLACILGVMKFLKTGQAAPWWLAATFLAPLIRYEGASFLLATVVLLAVHRRFATAALLLAAAVAALGGFSWFLIAHGLPPLPNSVLVKLQAPASGVPAGIGPALRMFATTLSANVVANGFPQLIGLGVVLAVGARMAWRAQDKARQQLACFGLAVVAAHLLVGRFGWFGRYEIYVLLSATCLAAAVWAPRVAPYAATLRGIGLATVLVWLLAPMIEYPWRTLETPFGARSIYAQQHRMAQFVRDYWRAPVAVNDLGQVSYGNKYYVLDLWGLGSDEARRARAEGRGSTWIATAARQHDARMAMLTPAWFNCCIPDGWQHVATLTFAGPLVSVPTRDVNFYATDAASAPLLRSELTRFAHTLPSPTSISFP